MYVYFFLLIIDIKKSYTNDKVKKLLTNCIYSEDYQYLDVPDIWLEKKNFLKK